MNRLLLAALGIAVFLAAGALTLTGCGGGEATGTASVATAADTTVVDTSGATDTGAAADTGTAATTASESDLLFAQGVALEAVLAAVTSGDKEAVRKAVDALVKTSTCPACSSGTRANLEEAITVIEEKYPDLAAPLQQALDDLPPES